MKWTVILTKEIDPEPEHINTYNAECLDLPGAFSYGEGLDNAVEMIKESIAAWLEMAVKYGDPVPSGNQIYDLTKLDDHPDYVVIVDVPIPQAVAA